MQVIALTTIFAVALFISPPPAPPASSDSSHVKRIKHNSISVEWKKRTVLCSFPLVPSKSMPTMLKKREKAMKVELSFHPSTSPSSRSPLDSLCFLLCPWMSLKVILGLLTTLTQSAALDMFPADESTETFDETQPTKVKAHLSVREEKDERKRKGRKKSHFSLLLVYLLCFSNFTSLCLIKHLINLLCVDGVELAREEMKSIDSRLMTMEGIKTRFHRDFIIR